MRFYGDTVALWDRRLQRLMLYAPNGMFSRHVALRVPEATEGRLLAFSPTVRDGTTNVLVSRFPTIGAQQDLQSYVLSVSATGDVRDTLATSIGFASVFWQASFGAGRFDSPMQRKPLIAFFEDGGFILGRNDTASADIYDARGAKRRSILLPLPAPAKVEQTDRVAYVDSIKRSSEREMLAQRYGPTLQARFSQQVEILVKEIKYPALRQQYDQLVLAEPEGTIWVLLPGIGRSYARTWLVCDVTGGRLLRRVMVPHHAAVIAAVVHDGALYAIEQSVDGIPRVAKYAR
jgi:hypothetical protein